jgi:hypothetical protein
MHESRTVVVPNVIMRNITEVLHNTVIELANATELTLVEEAFKQVLTPVVNTVPQQLWEGRPPLRDELRPDGFYGTISNMTLTVMNDPVRTILTAKQRNLTFRRGTSAAGITGQRIQTMAAEGRLVGLQYAADATSSSRPDIQTVSAELWLYPSTTRDLSNYGPIRRGMTKPELKPERCPVDPRLQRIGVTVLYGLLGLKRDEH